MYQNCCKKCGSIALHIEQKGSQVGLYCDDCGAWQKWCSKDEQRAFEYTERENKVFTINYTEKEQAAIDNFMKSYRSTNGLTIINRLQRFVDFLDNAIDKEFEKLPVSPEDAIRKSSYCLALERDKNAIINIINGKEFDYVE